MLSHHLYKSLKRIFAIFISPILWILYYASGLIRRDEKIIVFGSADGELFGNTKYALQDVDFEPHARKIWIAHKISQAQILRTTVRNDVFYRWSLSGMYAAARASKHYVNCYPKDTNVWMSRKAEIVNLWHGIPLKKIENHIENGPMAIYFNPKGFRQKLIRALASFVNFGAFKKSDIVHCHSPIWTQLIASAFGISKDRVVAEPSPVLRHLIQKSNISNASRKCAKKILYLPTMRDAYQANWIASGPLGNLDDLDAFCLMHSTELHIKLHPNEKYRPTNFNNLHFKDGAWDVYEHIPNFDLVITDYSSLAFELDFASVRYSLYWFDLLRYKSSNRDLYFDLESAFLGRKMYDLNDFKKCIFTLGEQYTVKLDMLNLTSQIETIFKH